MTRIAEVTSWLNWIWMVEKGDMRLEDAVEAAKDVLAGQSVYNCLPVECSISSCAGVAIMLCTFCEHVFCSPGCMVLSTYRKRDEEGSAVWPECHHDSTESG